MAFFPQVSRACDLKVLTVYFRPMDSGQRRCRVQHEDRAQLLLSPARPPVRHCHTPVSLPDARLLTAAPPGPAAPRPSQQCPAHSGVACDGCLWAVPRVWGEVGLVSVTSNKADEQFALPTLESDIMILFVYSCNKTSRHLLCAKE